MVKHGCDRSEAAEIAQKLCNEVTDYYASDLIKAKPYRLTLHYTSEFEKHSDFDAINQTLQATYLTDNAFKNSVDSFADYYFSRVLDDAVNHNVEVYKGYARKYLIEELAIMAICNHEGKNVLIYPGVIKTIYDIITMNHPSLIRYFTGYQFVSLRLKRL